MTGVQTCALPIYNTGFRPAVAELKVVRRSLPAVPRIAPAMANSEANITSGSSGFVSDALSSLHLLGFGHAGTLAAMRRVAPVCPSARLSVRVCASLSLSSARRVRASSDRVQACLPRGFPPTPKPPFVSQPPIHQDGPQHAAARSAAATCTRRSALTRRGWRESERTPNHALQRTPGFGVQLPSAAVARPAQSRAVRPAMKPGTARAFASRRRAHSRAPGPESLSLGSLGVISRIAIRTPDKPCSGSV